MMELPEFVVNHAQSRHYNAWPDAVVHLHDREPKIHMLVVPACNEFVRPEKKDWPGSDLLADKVAVSLFHVQYFQMVGTSRPARPATLLRAISIRFIQPGRCPKIPKKMSTTSRSDRLRGAQ